MLKGSFFYKNGTLFMLAVLLSAFGRQAVFSQEQNTEKPLPDILIGVEYFAGWWQGANSKWVTENKDWRLDYPDRVPLLGEYNAQETMDREIVAAADHGVDFFSILWYYDKNVTKTGQSVKDPCDELNSAVGYFINSPYADRMKFMIELTNHAPFAIISDEDWDYCIDVCIDAMRSPSYLRIDGRPVIKIHAGDQLFADFDGDVDRCRKMLQRIRKRVQDAGAGDLLITVGTYGPTPINAEHNFVKSGEINGTMQYMDVPNRPLKKECYPYEEVVALSKEMRDVHENDLIPWTPYLPAGWYPRPWKDPRADFALPTEQQWRAALVGMKNDLERTGKFGFPRRDGSIQKAFTIYAWNEYGEGGFISPTQGTGYMKLEVIKDVFRR